MKTYTYRVTQNNGELCSEHYTLAAAEKMVRRLVAQSNGKRTADFWTIEAI